MSMSIEKALDKIADVLTETTNDSNGSIEYSLSVIADALANGGGGGTSGAMAVTFTMDLSTETITADKTFAQISQAIANGEYVYAKYGDDVYQLASVRDNRISFLIVIVTADSAPKTVCAQYVSITSGDVCEYSEEEVEIS